jgi:hypothetical protein
MIVCRCNLLLVQVNRSLLAHDPMMFLLLLSRVARDREEQPGYSTVGPK